VGGGCGVVTFFPGSPTDIPSNRGWWDTAHGPPPNGNRRGPFSGAERFSKPRRPGLTRIEFLVILAIVVILAGLIVVAVGRIRDEANSLKCRNNLKQLGLAVHNYYSTHETLPPLTDQGEGAPTGRGLPSLFANIVPFIEATPFRFRPEQSADYYHGHSSVGFPYRHKDGTAATEYGGMANQFWHIYVDPADSTADRLRDIPMTLPDGTTGYYATASYAANGLLPWGARRRPGSPPPWSAETILFAERPQVCRTASGEEIYNLWGLGIYSPHMPAFATLTPAEAPGLLSTDQVAPVRPLPDEGAADQIRVRIGRHDAEPGAPDFPSPIQRIRSGRPCDPRLPGTPHAAGMQALMADGSVRVFARDTSTWAFWAACVPPSSGP
jgi:type II secretory pathway pseudopilin PulG